MKDNLVELYKSIEKKEVLDYQEKLENIIYELIENAFPHCSDPEEIVEAYGVVYDCGTMKKAYQDIAKDLDINENNIGKISTELIDSDLLKNVEGLLEEAYRMSNDGDIQYWENAEEFVTSNLFDRPEYDFVTDYSDCIDFEKVADKMFKYDDSVRVFDGSYYMIFW